MKSIVAKLLVIERKIDATEADGKRLKCSYYKWRYRRLVDKLSKTLREDAEKYRKEKQKELKGKK
jgi:hypothetical protein